MKKIKMILALIIAMVIMCVSVSTVFANDSGMILVAKMYDLLYLCEEAHFAYGIGYSIEEEPQPGSQIKPKYLACSDTTEAEKAWREACDMVEGYFDSHLKPYEGEINEQTATEKYNALYEELYKITIDRSELEKLVAFCEKESNADGYYEAQLWNDFQAEIAQSKEILADESITDLRVNSTFYELMYKFNLLCTSNEVAYDVDQNGEITIMDATYIQRYLVGYETINSSQILVVDRWRTANVNVMDATHIQRICAKLDTFYASAGLDRLLENIEKTNLESLEFELSSFMYNYIYYLGENNSIK